MTNAEEFKKAKVHPFARIIAKHPLKVVGASLVVFLAVAGVGGQAINVQFGAPSGRTAYSPTNAVETYRMDMVINAQRTVSIKSSEVERQTVQSQGMSILFEETHEDRSPNRDAAIFTRENLERMLTAQHIITEHADFDKYCLRCPVQDSLECDRSKGARDAAFAVVSALNSSDTSTLMTLAATMAAKSGALCDILPATCAINTLAKEVKAAIDGGATTSVESSANDVYDGARATADGVCALLPGCEDATEDDPVCQHAYSPLTYFYDDEDDDWNDIDDAFKKLDNEIDAPDPEDISDRVSVFPANFYLPHYYEKGDRKAHATRLTVLMGLPLDGYEDENDRLEEQENKIETFLIGLIPALEEYRKSLDAEGKVTMRWIGSTDIINHYFQGVLQRDVTFAAGAIIFVFAYILFHTRSVFIAVSSLLGVVLCFPVGAFWTIVVFKVTFFDPLNVFLLFILLGLGADGVFIVFDAWEQSKEGMKYWREMHGDDATIYRMSYVWRRAAMAMFACNITTALAFCAAIPSPVMPMAAFGILAALTIIHNWALDVTVVPAILLIWETYLRHNWLCCCLPKRVLPKRDDLAQDNDIGAVRVEEARRDKLPIEDGDGAHGSLNATERFFRDRYAPFIIRFRFPIVIIMASFIGVMVFFTTQLEPDRESPQILPDKHPIWEAMMSIRDQWMEGEGGNRGELRLVWGIKANDYLTHTKFEFGSEVCNDGPCGHAVFDDSFDPSSKDMQEYLLDACEEAAEIDATRGKLDTEFIYDDEISRCLMKDFKAWLQFNQKDFPVEDEDDFWEEMHEYLKAPTNDDAAGEGYSYVQKELVRVGDDDDKRMYFLISSVSIDFNPNLFYGIPQIMPGREAAYAFEEEYNAKRPNGQPKFFVTTSQGLFTSMRMQQAYISSTVTGVITAMGFALASLIIFVGNLVVAIQAFVCIGGVVCCTLGLMVLQGWKLGLIEAICATIVVGFSVDYIVHYALAFVAAPQHKRGDKLTHALVEVGISVQAGAITTMGASAFLLLTTIRFFFKFGVFMLSTVAFSLLTANFAFTAVLAIIGPEGDFGDMHKIINACRNRLSMRSPDASTARPPPPAPQ